MIESAPLALHEHRPAPAPRRGGVTELVLAGTGQGALLLPMVAHLAHRAPGRWVTWVVSTEEDRQLVQDQALAGLPIRLIHCTRAEDILWIVWEALAAGNSQTVIARPGRLGRKSLAHLEAAAERGECQGLLLRQR